MTAGEVAGPPARGDLLTAPGAAPPPTLGDAARAFAPSAALPWTDREDPGDIRGGVVLITTPENAAAIARGEHRIDVVNGKPLTYPSQRIDLIESTDHGDDQTHIQSRHMAQSLDATIARMTAEPKIPAAGGFTTRATAQEALDTSIALSQHDIGVFLASAGRLKFALPRVDVGHPIGSNLTRADLNAGNPQMSDSSAARVILIKDPSFDEGYRVLTAWADAKPPDIDATGKSLHQWPPRWRT